MADAITNWIINQVESAGARVTGTDLPQAIRDVQRDIADEILLESNNYLNEKGITFTGELAGSGEVVETEEGFDVVYFAEHASYVHEGTPPHPVSKQGVKNIRRWVRLKLRPTPEPGESQDDAIDRVTNAVVWKIRTQGTEPEPFLEAPAQAVADRNS